MFDFLPLLRRRVKRRKIARLEPAGRLDAPDKILQSSAPRHRAASVQIVASRFWTAISNE
jgi:hypothetical protein